MIILTTILVAHIFLALFYMSYKFLLIMKPPSFWVKLLLTTIVLGLCVLFNDVKAILPLFANLGLLEYYKDIGKIKYESND